MNNHYGIRVYHKTNKCYYTIIGVYKNGDSISIQDQYNLSLSKSDGGFVGVVLIGQEPYCVYANEEVYFEKIPDLDFYLNCIEEGTENVKSKINSKNGVEIEWPILNTSFFYDSGITTNLQYYTYYFDCSSGVNIITKQKSFNLKGVILDSELTSIQKTENIKFETSPESGQSYDLGNLDTFYISDESFKQINEDLVTTVGIIDQTSGQYVETASEITFKNEKAIITFNDISELSEGSSYYLYIPYNLIQNNKNKSSVDDTFILFSINETQQDPELIPANYNGLVKYYKNNVQASTNAVKKFNDIVLINSNLINQIKVFPALRARVQYETGDPVFIKYYNEEIPITVTVTLKIINGVNNDIKIFNVDYDQEFELPISDAQSILMTILFKIGDTQLERTIRFYKMSSYLFNRLSISGNTLLNNTFSASEYDSLIDLVSLTPVIEKWGSLLLTNEYDVIETKDGYGIGELVPTTKVRMGNLSGIYNETFGTNQPSGFGLYGESVYLTGNFYLNNGKSLVDISNDVTLAVGNINKIQNTLSNLNTTLIDSIYNLTIAQAENTANLTTTLNNQIEAAVTAMSSDFSGVIKYNTEALFKLGKDYSLWAVGNAGISIINPNVQYNSDGTINDSTVGDGDEFILMQGESVQIATNIIKNSRIKVICCNTNPTGFTYSSNLFNPENSGIQFYIGWINQSDLSSFTKEYVSSSTITVDEASGQITSDVGTRPFRYVALEKHLNIDSGQLTMYTSTVSRENCDVYSFSTFLNKGSNNIYTTSNGNELLDDYNYIIQDVTTAGMFIDGKFNASLINVENLVAVQEGYKNESFDPTLSITIDNNPSTDESVPYAVISGTTGKITAQGIDLKEATIGDPEKQSIHITDNQGIQEEMDQIYYPAIYFKKGKNICTKVSSVGEYTENESPIHIINDNTLTYNGIINFDNIEQQQSVSHDVAFNAALYQEDEQPCVQLIKYSSDDLTQNPFTSSDRNDYNNLNDYYNNILINLDSLNQYYYNGKKYIKHITKIILKPNESKFLSLRIINDSYSGLQFTLNNNNEDIKLELSAELIGGFRLTQFSREGGSVENPTIIYNVNHKWISKQICKIEYKLEENNLSNYEIKKNNLADLSNIQINNNEISILNNTNSNQIYYLEYVELFKITESDISDYIEDSDTIVLTEYNSSLSENIIYQDSDYNNYGQAEQKYNNFQLPQQRSDKLNYWINTTSESNLPIPKIINLSTSGRNISYEIKIYTNKLQTNLQGNGLGIIANNNNYFGSYLTGDSLNVKAISNAIGFCLSNEGIKDVIDNYSINRFITILQGCLESVITGFNNTPTYNFRGISLCQSQQSTNNHLIGIGAQVNGIYNNKHDIYIISSGYDIYIIFGEYWNYIFDKFGFSEEQLFIYFSEESYYKIETFTNEIVAKTNWVDSVIEGYLNKKYQIIITKSSTQLNPRNISITYSPKLQS